jgi:uncharacterized secreted repeat protein (TIGR03808 family)
MIFHMDRKRTIGRRAMLAGLAGATLLAPTAGLAKPAPTPKGVGMLAGTDFGIVPGAVADQSKAVQAALDAAHEQGRPLLLPAGHIFVRNLEFPGAIRVLGQPGATMLVAWLDNPVGKASLANDLSLESVGFSGSPGAARSEHGLLAIESSVGVRISNCRFLVAGTSGLLLQDSAATIEDCTFDQLDVAIFSRNSRGLTIRGNRIGKCGNGGILVWRDQPGPDGSIVTGNHIAHVLAGGGGNGQNGNGINIFRADRVVIADNVIDDCDFSAIRINAGTDTAIRGNTCTGCREVAIYSEFAFSGSLISGNIVDGAAAGISITNFDPGGRLAVCAGNIVRNITPNSPTNPDVTPYGIYAEADTAITGNTVDNVPGVGIGAGYGKYLRNVIVADNVVSDVETGIAVSVAAGVGPVRVAGNLISGARKSAIAGLRWEELASPDLAADAARYPGVSVTGNTVAL